MMNRLITLIPVVGCLLLPPEVWAEEPTSDQLLAKAKSRLAKVEGEITLPGLKEPVEVLRDRWGVPHIYAKNADDLFFAQGFIAAQDRLFQIDLWRRVAVGETAEVFGERGLKGDRFARLVKYRGDMEAEWRSYAPDARRIAEAFTRGINAFIDHAGDRLPIEFDLLGYRPKKWQPEDVLGRMSGIIMTRNFRQEVVRAHLIAAVGLEQARRLAPTDPVTEFAPPEGVDLAGLSVDALAGYEAATKPLEFKPAMSESNNWVVSGARSASGKPLLASDPHRSIALPSLRYLVHLNAPGWNVIGSGEPALPGVAIGHNERIAWGFTIVCTDQADLIIEELNPDNPDEYRSGDSWEKVEVVREKARVKGKDDAVDLELRFTKNGPVIHEDRKRNRALVLRWIGAEPGTAAYLASLAVDRAGNWKEFLDAMKAWKLPCENMVYADVDGNIGWVAAALTPVRQGHDGLLPVPASGPHRWQRYLDVSELPQEYNPARGWIATANHNILPEGYKHLIALEWSPGYRYRRVAQLMQSKDRFTLDDFKAFQHDVTSLPGKTLVKLIGQLDLKDPELEKHADVLRKWDGVLGVDSRGGMLYAVWMAELTKAFYHPRLPKELHSRVNDLGGVPVLLDALENPDENFFGANPKEARDQLLRTSFAQAVKVAERHLGDDPSEWTWGRLHKVTFRHPLGALGESYAGAFNLGPVGRPGDVNTPHNTRHNEKFEQIHGPTYRHVLDLSDWDRGLATSAPGQSGQLGSPHYGDLLPLWADGEYFPLAFSRKKVEEVTRHRLMLMPGKE